MANRLRTMRRAMERARSKPVRIPQRVYAAIQIAAMDLGTTPKRLVIATLLQGLENWARQKAEDRLIQIPGQDLHKQILEEAARGGS